MKLSVDPTPEGYTDNKAAVLTERKSGETIMLACARATETATEIAHAVNLFPSLVAVLEQFSSTSPIGQLLVSLEAGLPDKGNITKDKLARVINAVDVILKGEELHKELI